MTNISIKEHLVDRKTSSLPSQKSKVSSTPQPINLFNKNILKNSEKANIYLGLHTMLKSGLDMVTALDIVESEQKKEKDQKLLNKLKNLFINGASFSKAMQQVGCFSSYECESVKIGEETARLPYIFKSLSNYYLNLVKVRRKLIGLMTYPIIVILASFGVVAFMSKVLIPSFIGLYNSMGGEIPAFTKNVMNVFNGFMSAIPYLIVLIAIVIFTSPYYKNKDGYRKVTSSIIRRIPYLGNLVERIYILRFTSSMSLLLSSKIDLVQALEMAGNMINYYPLEKILQQSKAEILSKGINLYQIFSKYNFFDKKLLSVIRVGEEVNQLAEMFEQYSTQADEQIEHEMNQFSNVLQPVILLFVGAIVMVIMFAMFAPIINMSDLLK